MYKHYREKAIQNFLDCIDIHDLQAGSMSQKIVQNKGTAPTIIHRKYEINPSNTFEDIPN